MAFIQSTASFDRARTSSRRQDAERVILSKNVLRVFVPSWLRDEKITTLESARVSTARRPPCTDRPLSTRSDRRSLPALRRQGRGARCDPERPATGTPAGGARRAPAGGRVPPAPAARETAQSRRRPRRCPA